MLKRKSSAELGGRPHAGATQLPSIYGARPRRRRKLFRSKTRDNPRWQPQPEPAMPELLDFILQHEDAFQNSHRLSSLYADFRQQFEINPDGYHANVAAWTKALADASRAGLVPTEGATRNLLTIRTGDELVQALLHPQHGKPTCLPAVFHDAVQKKEMVPLKEFMNSKESIYKTSWLPSPWKIVQWGLRQVGVIGQPKLADTLGAGSFVVLKNTEVAAEAIFKKMQEHVSNADRVLSRADFLKRFATILNPAAPLTPTDVDILLIHLARDRQAISYNAQAIKFRSVHESMPEAITQEDEAIVNLRDTLANINAQIPPLMEKIVLAEAAAREAVAAKHMVQAKAALRSKKLAETALAQRTDIAIQLEGVYTQLQQAADQVGIVEAMRAGADALKSLNEKVGGAEGVQGVVDAVNEQMTTTDEIANIISEPSQPLDEMEIDDEFEALEKVEREKQDKIDAAKTAERLAQLEEAEQKQKDKEAQLAKEEAHRAREEMQRRKQWRKENVNTEDKVEEASFDLSKMSFYDASYEDENMEDAEDEKRVPVHV